MEYANYEGKQVHVSQVERGSIAQCIVCGEKVITKVGKKLSYFAHEKGKSEECELKIKNMMKKQDKVIEYDLNSSEIDNIYGNVYNDDIESINGFTDEQENIIVSKEARVIVNSVAGSGKSTVGQEYCKRNTNKSILYTTFSKSLVEEAKLKIGELTNVDVRTLHSLAYGEVGYKYREKLSVDINIFDVAKAIDIFMKSPDDFKLVDGIKLCFEYFLTSPYDTVDDMCDAKDGFKPIRKYLKVLYKKSKDKDNKVKITHDFYLKEWCVSKPDLSEYSVLIADEIQDFNGAFLKVMQNLDMEKIIAIGDSRQNIFGFANSTNAFEILTDGWNEYKLTKCFRVGNTLAKVVEGIVGHKLNTDFKFVGYNKAQKIVKKVNRDEKHMVLCRYNATIIKNVIEKSLEGKKCYIEGGSARIDFSFIEKIFEFKFRNKQHFTLKKYDNYQHMLASAKRGKDFNILLCDKLIEQYGIGLGNMLKQAQNNVVKKFKDCDIGYSTIHKIKGATITDPVVIAEDSLTLSEIDVENEISELNLKYVALTRCKGEMEVPDDVLNYYLNEMNDDCWEDIDYGERYDIQNDDNRRGYHKVRSMLANYEDEVDECFTEDEEMNINKKYEAVARAIHKDKSGYKFNLLDDPSNSKVENMIKSVDRTERYRKMVDENRMPENPTPYQRELIGRDGDLSRYDMMEEEAFDEVIGRD